jgi:hypothetical protein
MAQTVRMTSMLSERPIDADECVDRWAASGAMTLTGRPQGPFLGPPARLVGGLLALGDDFHARTDALGAGVTIDPLALLGERAALAGLHRGGSISCGRASRLLGVRNGWIAVSLARAADVDLVPAWLGVEAGEADPWPVVTDAVRQLDTVEVLQRATGLGLPVGAVGERGGPPGSAISARSFRKGPAITTLSGVVVTDLSSLWAGPLCGSLLAAAGADVIKVESTERLDGARLGSPEFYDVCNAGKRAVALDLRTSRGRALLVALLERADVVIDASRPRALTQLGVEVDRVLESGSHTVWISITGYGREGGDGERVAFGDDAAAAGGLVVWDHAGPCFCADAVADPISGLVATDACLGALAAGGSWLVAVSMADVAARYAGPTLTVPSDVTPAAPRSRRAARCARPVGADTARVLAGLGI